MRLEIGFCNQVCIGQVLSSLSDVQGRRAWRCWHDANHHCQIPCSAAHFQVPESWVPVMQIRVMCKSDGRFEKGVDGIARYKGGETRLAQISTSGSMMSWKEALGRAFPVPASLSPEVSYPASIVQKTSKLLLHTHSIVKQGLCAATVKPA